LTGLKTQAQLAIREAEGRQIRFSLEHLANSVDRATRLVNQLLTMARTEAAGTQVPSNSHESIDLDNLARLTVETWVEAALRRGIDIGYEGCPQSGDAMLSGNSTLLRELLNNLIDNALRYTPAQMQAKVTCRVRVEAATKRLLLEVEDNGIGIAAEHRERVFDRFYRADESISNGSGLGLAIVREIAQQHHGTVSISPNPERGITVCVAFQR